MENTQEVQRPVYEAPEVQSYSEAELSDSVAAFGASAIVMP